MSVSLPCAPVPLSSGVPIFELMVQRLSTCYMILAEALHLCPLCNITLKYSLKSLTNVTLHQNMSFANYFFKLPEKATQTLARTPLSLPFFLPFLCLSQAPSLPSSSRALRPFADPSTP